MGVVINQSIKNTVITYLGFGVGAINVLFLYTKFMTPEYFGLITFILSTALVMMPLMAFGTHNTIVKFYSSFKTRQTQNSFLTLMLILPLIMAIILGAIGYSCFDLISNWLSKENTIVKDYVWFIYIAAICFAYFEVFYAWAKVQMQSVFGNFMKEVFHRVVVTILLCCLYFKWLTIDQFIYSIVGMYAVRMAIMALYAFSVRSPVLCLKTLPNLVSILKYTTLIIIAGSVATIILEIDKVMIGRYYPEIAHVAYYGVAIYIASVIGVPSRSMHQITYPLTAKLLNDNNKLELEDLYHKSSLSLFIISGFIFLLIILNINQLYQLIPEEYTGGLLVIFVIGIAKLFDNLLGNNNAILFNSDYYRMILLFGFFLAVLAIALNIMFIPKYGIDGAAIATCIAVFAYNTVKIVFVYSKFKMLPFTTSTFKTLILMLICFAIFYFWEFPFNPIINIVLKSALLGFSYGLVVYKLNFSEDITALLNKYIKR